MVINHDITIRSGTNLLVFAQWFPFYMVMLMDQEDTY